MSSRVAFQGDPKRIQKPFGLCAYDQTVNSTMERHITGTLDDTVDGIVTEEVTGQLRQFFCEAYENFWVLHKYG
ncbi:MAG: hypothetical protein RBR37_07210 [Advenella sp.]|nr:hypothetical protein [Advenella sp.]NLN69112.1 hypothetical protein [Alcaligenaceae bacterium]